MEEATPLMMNSVNDAKEEEPGSDAILLSICADGEGDHPKSQEESYSYHPFDHSIEPPPPYHTRCAREQLLGQDLLLLVVSLSTLIVGAVVGVPIFGEKIWDSVCPRFGRAEDETTLVTSWKHCEYRTFVLEVGVVYFLTRLYVFCRIPGYSEYRMERERFVNSILLSVLSIDMFMSAGIGCYLYAMYFSAGLYIISHTVRHSTKFFSLLEILNLGFLVRYVIMPEQMTGVHIAFFIFAFLSHTVYTTIQYIADFYLPRWSRDTVIVTPTSLLFEIMYLLTLYSVAYRRVD